MSDIPARLRRIKEYADEMLKNRLLFVESQHNYKQSVVSAPKQPKPQQSKHQQFVFKQPGLTGEQRFWSLVDKSDGCWGWKGSRRKGGYGDFRPDGRHVSAHRFSYELHFGPIPEGLLVCHHCDNPPCCNPDHLYLGTVSDNTKDYYNRRNRNISTQ